MEMLRSVTVQCPYCWQQTETVVDISLPRQEYVEDCAVCCNPVILEIVSSEEDVVSVEVRKENE